MRKQIVAIMLDASLSEVEKAERRQALLSGKWAPEGAWSTHPRGVRNGPGRARGGLGYLLGGLAKTGRREQGARGPRGRARPMRARRSSHLVPPTRRGPSLVSPSRTGPCWLPPSPNHPTIGASWRLSPACAGSMVRSTRAVSLTTLSFRPPHSRPICAGRQARVGRARRRRPACRDRRRGRGAPDHHA